MLLMTVPIILTIARYSVAGDIIVVDSENSRLQIFSNEGKLKSIIGTKGSMPHELNHPMCVCLSNDVAEFENILVTDSVNACVKVNMSSTPRKNSFL